MTWYLTGIIWIGYAVGVGWLAFPGQPGWWIMGVAIAALLYAADRVVYVWWLKPYEQLSLQIQYWWQRRDWRTIISLLTERGKEQTKLILRSLMFMLAWPLVAVYMLTSTGSITGSGVVMGLGLGLTMAILADWKEVRQLKKWLCWQIKRELSEREVRLMAGAFVSLFAVLTVMVLAR